MSDIVDRLRAENSVVLAFGQDLSDLLLVAADEIERLRAERDRLREAVRELLRVGVRVAGLNDRRLFSADDEHPLFDTLDEWRTAADAARAALEETGHE
jgi:hypothetical protein